MIRVLDALMDGLAPEGGCPACRGVLTHWCEGCSDKLADEKRVNEAIDAVQSAPTEDEAVTAFWDCIGAVTGLTAEGRSR